jgi:lambda family phage portal protein
MNLLSRLKTVFAPKAHYEQAQTPQRRKAGWAYTGTSAMQSTSPFAPALKARARAAVRNDPWASKALDSMVSNLIGTGVVARPASKDSALRETLNDLWQGWAEECDSTDILDLYGIQSLVARSWLESGEVFIRLRSRYPEDMEVPLQLQVIESDQVSFKNEVLSNGHIIRSGIEYDALGCRVAYWIHPNHPGETLVDTRKTTNNDPIRIPSQEVLHVFKPLRPGQERGVTIFAQVLVKIESMNNYDDAMLLRQELSNMFVAFIRKNPEHYPPDPDSPALTPEQLASTLKPGAAKELLPGEDVEFTRPPDAGNNYPDFMRQQLMSLCAGIGLPYELLSGDYSHINDRTMRIAINDFRRKLEADQWNIIIAQFLKPMRKAWVDAAILAGHVKMTDRKEAIKTNWTPHAHAYIHPKQDIEGKLLKINNGLTTKAQVISDEGYDPAQVLAEVEQERKALSNQPKA